MTASVSHTGLVDSLMTASAVRERCSDLFENGLTGTLPWFDIDMDRLEFAAQSVFSEIQSAYPDLNVPFHSRWRHFEFDGVDLWAELADTAGLGGKPRLVAEGDLAIVSVLLDAGAGPDWAYTDEATGLRLGRSEGLALASLRLFSNGLLSADPSDPLRADSTSLQLLSAEDLGSAMQVGPDNPLVGLDQRTALLRRLGEITEARPDLFRRDGIYRPGNLLNSLAKQGGITAPGILAAVLDGFNRIWPSRLKLDGVPLGDVWRHSCLHRDDNTDGLVPFHKLSQWLSYSLIEPLQRNGTPVTELDGLTGLAEYRNGGLFIDSGVLSPKDAAIFETTHKPGDEIIVEWRALTVALLDRTAEAVRSKLGLTVDKLPLASVLQGGTWTAGRRAAAEKRADGGPPLKIDSDGTVF